MHFGVTVAGTPGDYFNNASATSADYTVAPTGDTAQVTVTGPVTRTLTVNKAGSGTGTVTSSPAGIDCGATCAASFGDGASVTLTGTPGADTQAVAWSGCDSVNGSNQCIVAMTAAKSVTATFNLVQRTLTVTKNGTGSGTVTSSPPGSTAAPPAARSTTTGSRSP